MAPRPLTFRERDVQAAIRAVEKTGKSIHAVEIARDGTIRIVTEAPTATVASKRPPGLKGWDDV